MINKNNALKHTHAQQRRVSVFEKIVEWWIVILYPLRFDESLRTDPIIMFKWLKLLLLFVWLSTLKAHLLLQTSYRMFYRIRSISERIMGQTKRNWYLVCNWGYILPIPNCFVYIYRSINTITNTKYVCIVDYGTMSNEIVSMSLLL